MTYLNTREAAAYLGYTEATFRGYLAKGKITPDLRLTDRGVGFTKETLDAFKASRGLPGRRKVTLTAEQWQEAGRRFHAGETLHSVAAAYSVSPEYLHRKVGSRKGSRLQAPSSREGEERS
ncbi:MAG TPA: hypothetical protein VGP44_04425 [Gemmatimonadales bacterium]|nr:hypothetical protein [Gemmatimonadales bacterium]